MEGRRKRRPFCFVAPCAAGSDARRLRDLAPDTIDHALRAYACHQAGDEAGAEAAYRDVLPAIVFIMQSIETMICYGKRVMGARAGIAIHDRGPAMRPTAFGLALVEKYARHLGSYRGVET